MESSMIENSTVTEFMNYFVVAAVITGVISVYYFSNFCLRLKRKQPLKSLQKLFGLAVFSMITGFFSLIVIGTQGYQALTHEILAATITITPTSEQKFIARVVYPDGYSESYSLRGDEVMLEANILKWKPWSTILGLKTAYRLDRIRGRFKDISQEQAYSPTVYQIFPADESDIAEWRNDFRHLAFLVDVEHGSASYVDATESQVYQLFVTTDSLLLRAK
jgi:hypothetical protein